MRLLMAVGMMMLAGCAASPYAWQDLGDGEGMRGWAGIPLKYSVPVGLASGAQGFNHGYCNAPQQQIPTFIPPNIQGPVIIPQQTQYTPIPPTFIPSPY